MSYLGNPGNRNSWGDTTDPGMPPLPSYHAPGQTQPYGAPLRQRSGRPHPWRPGRARRIILAVIAIVIVVASIAAGLLVHRLADFGSAISRQSPFSTQTGYMSGVGRVNLVVLGYGGVGHDGAYLTDSLMVISIVPSTGATSMISVPRDVWVQIPPGSGQYGKINSAFENGISAGFQGMPAGMDAGGAEAANKVSDVLGMDVPYWMSINFSGFRDLVDALGGVTMNVPTAFTARYPRNDDPQIDASWKTIHFNTGLQHFNGEQAIEYARARYVLSPASEGTDFARSARQQLLIKAIADRIRQPSAWPGLLNALQALQKTIHTNLSMADLGLFTSKLQLSKAAHIGLSNQNVLQDGTGPGGQYILQPRDGDWAGIRSYVASHLAK